MRLLNGRQCTADPGIAFAVYNQKARVCATMRIFGEECNKSSSKVAMHLLNAPPPLPTSSYTTVKAGGHHAQALEEVVWHALAALCVVFAALVRRRCEHVEEHTQRLIDLQH